MISDFLKKIMMNHKGDLYCNALRDMKKSAGFLAAFVNGWPKIQQYFFQGLAKTLHNPFYIETETQKKLFKFCHEVTLSASTSCLETKFTSTIESILTFGDLLGYV